MSARPEASTASASPSIESDRRGPAWKPHVAIIGAGPMGRCHADAARRLGAAIVGIADRDAGRAQRLAQRHSGALAVAHATDLLGRGRLDAVHVCTPLETHAELTRQAIEAGIHVLIEKPLAATEAVTREMVGLAQQAGVVLCPVHQMAFQDGVIGADAALARLGAVRRIDFEICSAGGAARQACEQDAIVAEILPHPLSLLRRLWPSAAMEPSGWAVHRPGGGEVLLSGTHGGALLSVAISMRARPTCFDMTVRCERGTIQLDLFHGFSTVQRGAVSRIGKVSRPFTGAAGSLLAAAGNLGRRGLAMETAYPGLRTLVQRFYVAVRDGTAPPVAFADTIAVAAARDAVMAMMSQAGAG